MTLLSLWLVCASVFAEPADGAAEFNLRLEKAIAQSKDNIRIELQDMLGEGEGAWDSDPRVPTNTLNCMTWLQWVLALAYMPDTPHLALDAIRYYNSEPYFATRKHYIDRWLMLEPGPLQPIAQSLAGHVQKNIQLELSRLTQSRGYACELSAPLHNSIDFAYLPSAVFLERIAQLERGWYVVFPVAKPSYYTVLYPESGPMGQVHSMILDLRTETPQLWHASIDYASVVHEAPADFAHRMRELIDGFSIYTLNPNWLPSKTTEAMWPSTAQSIRCEQELVQQK